LFGKQEASQPTVNIDDFLVQPLNHDIADSEEPIFDFTISPPNNHQTIDDDDESSTIAQIFTDSDKTMEDDLIETFSSYNCSNCGKKFRRKDNRKLHERHCDDTSDHDHESPSKRQKITDYFSAGQNAPTATTTFESKQIGGGTVNDIFTSSITIIFSSIYR